MKKILYVSFIIFCLCNIFFCMMLSYDDLSGYIPSILIDDIAHIGTDVIDKRNDTSVVFIEGNVTVDEVLVDSLYGVRKQAIALKRKVRRTIKGEHDYLENKCYRANYKNCKSGCFFLKGYDSPASIEWTIIPLTEVNIPASLQGRARVIGNSIHIKECDGSLSIVSFEALGESSFKSRIVGRQLGNVIEVSRVSVPYPFDYEWDDPRNAYHKKKIPKITFKDMITNLIILFAISSVLMYTIFYCAKKMQTDNIELRCKMIYFVISISLVAALFIWLLYDLLNYGLHNGYKYKETLALISYCSSGMLFCCICAVILMFFLLLNDNRNIENWRQVVEKSKKMLTSHYHPIV